MKVICKVEGAYCPEDLKICCGICEYKASCVNCCEHFKDYQNCDDAEVITEEMIQFESAIPDTIKQITTLLRMKKEVEITYDDYRWECPFPQLGG